MCGFVYLQIILLMKVSIDFLLIQCTEHSAAKLHNYFKMKIVISKWHLNMERGLFCFPHAMHGDIEQRAYLSYDGKIDGPAEELGPKMATSKNKTEKNMSGKKYTNKLYINMTIYKHSTDRTFSTQISAWLQWKQQNAHVIYGSIEHILLGWNLYSPFR